MSNSDLDINAVTEKLNRILEAELAGVVRYTHYSLMIFGYSRIPVVSWFQNQASESLVHAQQAGEWITHFGQHPSLKIGPLLETHHHEVGDMLKETLEAEHAALDLYYGLLELVQNRSVSIEEYARQMIQQEEMHIDSIDKMLRPPGHMEVSSEEAKLSS